MGKKITKVLVIWYGYEKLGKINYNCIIPKSEIAVYFKVLDTSSVPPNHSFED